MDGRTLRDGGTSEQDGSPDNPERDVSGAPSEVTYQDRGQRCDRHGSESDSSDRYSHRRVAPFEKPSTHHRDHRDVGRGDPGPHSDAVGEVADPQAADESG